MSREMIEKEIKELKELSNSKQPSYMNQIIIANLNNAHGIGI